MCICISYVGSHVYIYSYLYVFVCIYIHACMNICRGATYTFRLALSKFMGTSCSTGVCLTHHTHTWICLVSYIYEAPYISECMAECTLECTFCGTCVCLRMYIRMYIRMYTLHIRMYILMYILPPMARVCVSHIDNSHHKHIFVSRHISKFMGTSCSTGVCLTYEYVTIDIYVARHNPNPWVHPTALVCVSHINQSRHKDIKLTSHIPVRASYSTGVWDICLTYECVTSHINMCHVTYPNPWAHSAALVTYICIWSVIQSNSPISMYLVSFQRNVVKET